MGHISEKTDSFAFGVIILELLTNLHPKNARNVLDMHGTEGIADFLLASTDKLGWPKPVARIITDVCSACIAASVRRKTPAEVVDELGRAYKLATNSGGARESSGLLPMGWFG